MLEHLSQEDLVSLMQEYYSGIPNKQLIEKYNLPKNQGIYKFFPEFERKDLECPYCHVPMYSKRASKTERNIRGQEYEPDAKCHNCGHQIFASRSHGYRELECRCPNCQQKKEEEIARKEKAVQQFCAQKNQDPLRKESALSFRDRVLLGGVLLSQTDINANYIASETKLIKKFSPEYRDQSIRYPLVCWYLFKKNPDIFIAQDKVPIDAFEWKDGKDFDSFDTSEIPYIISLDAKSYTDICFNSFFTVADIDAALQFWYEIAIEECLEYLSVLIDRFPGFPELEVNDKMRLTLHNMLEQSSVSQIFYLLYKSLDYTSRMYAEGKMRKTNIPAAAVTSAATSQKRYLANNWSIPEYHRTKDNPVSVLSSYFFNVVLKIGDKGFSCPPSKKAILEKWSEITTEEDE